MILGRDVVVAKRIAIRWTGIPWVLEGDIKKCFDTIDHNLLMQLLDDVILDQEFTKLIRKALKVGYFEF
jgi:nicotine oxidoreductase